MYREAKRSSWVEINLSNLDFNIKNIRKKVRAGTEIIGIVKADAYGHGAYEVTRVLIENGVKAFGIATLQEAISLREKGITEEIILLSLIPDMFVDVLIEYGITPIICEYENAALISAEAKKAGKIVYGIIAADTGMGRIGLLTEEPGAIAEIRKISTLPNLKIKGLHSHFATSDTRDKSFAEEQAKRYASFVDKLRAEGVNINYRTFANSGAVMEISSSHYEAVRPGIIIYGCYPSDEVDKREIELKPVMSVKANIMQLKKVPPGTSISYGRTFITTRESLIASIALGYADGYPRPCSARAKVIVGGALAPLAGTICMDYCMVDVTDVPGVRAGGEVIVMGREGENIVSAEDLAAMTGTINYEILCAFGQRLPKVYKGVK